MDFIRDLREPLIIGIIFYFIYMVFELFGRKKERIMLVEKMGENIDPKFLEKKVSSLLPTITKKSFTGLKIGCLLLGIGLGLLVGLLINVILQLNDNFFNVTDYMHRDMFFSVAYSASVLLFGGMGLIVAHVIESRERRRDNKENKE